MGLTEVSSLLKHNDPRSQLELIEWLVFLTFLLLVTFPLVESTRKRCNNVALQLFAWLNYSAVTLLIAYVLGLMRNFDGKHKLLPIWAAFLLVAYGKIATSIGIGDQKTNGAYLAKLVVYVFYICLIFARYPFFSYLPLCFVLFFSDFIWKGRAEFILKSKECVLEDITAKSDEYVPLSQRLISKCVETLDLDPDLDPGQNVDIDEPTNNDNPLLACNYVVDPSLVKMRREKFVDRGITVKQIWVAADQQGGCFVCSTRQLLKSTCLSFSLFWLLLHRFAGVPSYENSHPKKAWKLIQHILRQENERICPFKVIEVELAFLYDYFYNRKHFSFYQGSFRVGFCRRLLFFGSIISIFPIAFVKYHSKNQTVSIHYHNLDMDVLVTVFVIVAIILLEIVQFFTCATSRWSQMKLLCIYLSRNSSMKQSWWDCCIHRMARILFYFRIQHLKPWQRKLGQYSLLDSCSFMQSYYCKVLLHYLNSVVGFRIATPGRKQSNATTLSNDIKQAIIETLRAPKLNLNMGRVSLDASGLTPKIKEEISSFFKLANTDIHVVLVWHIATSMCEINPDSRDLRKCLDFKVATKLSKYCAYLVAYAPDLLPGNSTTTEAICTMVIENACRWISRDDVRSKKWLGFKTIIPYDGLQKISFDFYDIFDKQPDSLKNNVFLLGVILGRKLCMEFVTDGRRRWSLLAKFWVEMTLYLAPNASNEWAHAERLADGGEFITHLWALLFHAGIVDRDNLTETN